MSTALLVGIGIVILLAIAWALFRMVGRREKDDLGTISDSWVNQHRASTHDPGR